jgi:hypothetical protein
MVLYAAWLLMRGHPCGGTHASVIALAATALVVGCAGVSLLRWQERREVARFDEAGYDFLGELEVSHLRALRDRAAEELHRTPPTTRGSTAPA